jgi:hypothetical protein
MIYDKTVIKSMIYDKTDKKYDKTFSGRILLLLARVCHFHHILIICEQS